MEKIHAASQLQQENAALELKRKLNRDRKRSAELDGLIQKLYGPLDQAIYDCRIAPYAADERDLAKLHMTRLLELGLGGSPLPCMRLNTAFQEPLPKQRYVLNIV